jgi:hypothetical protein
MEDRSRKILYICKGASLPWVVMLCPCRNHATNFCKTVSEIKIVIRISKKIIPPNTTICTCTLLLTRELITTCFGLLGPSSGNIMCTGIPSN